MKEDSIETKKKNIFQRIIQVMEEVEYIQKQDSANGMRYKFVSHDSVMAVLHKPMAKAGIVFCPNTEFYGHNGSYYELKLSCDFINADNPEDRITTRIQLPSKFSGDEKGYGSSLSYAIKYILLKTFMLETGEDADANASDDDKPKKSDKFIPKPQQKNPIPSQSVPPETPIRTTVVRQQVPNYSCPESVEKDYYLGKDISKLLPNNIPVPFVRDYLVAIMKAKNLSWEETQEEALKNMSAFLNSVEKRYVSAREQKDNTEKLSKTI